MPVVTVERNRVVTLVRMERRNSAARARLEPAENRGAGVGVGVAVGVSMKTTRCEGGCGARTTASGGVCRTCQSKRFHARKDVDTGAVIVDEMAGGWWIWAKNGEVLVMDKPSKDAAIRAYINGERAEDDAA